MRIRKILTILCLATLTLACDLTIDDCPNEHYMVNKQKCECECNVSWSTHAKPLTCVMAPGLKCQFNDDGKLCADDSKFLDFFNSSSRIQAMSLICMLSLLIGYALV